MTVFSTFYGRDKKQPQDASPASLLPQPPTELRNNAAHLDEDKTQLRQALSPEKASPPGKIHLHYQQGDTILANYRVEDVITTGGMGVIYVTTHIGWGVKVAIKSPTEEMLNEKEFATRIMKEADAWTNLGFHPHIAYCYFVRNIEEVPHIFVEYLDGGNLKDWIESGMCADLKIALDLAIQFCHGMAYAHSKGLIHRDIKPANILMTKDGILKITDFGIARFEKDIPFSQNGNLYDDNKTRGFIGTKYYASPEQLRDAHSVTEETDIFSFGVCLWEMLLGRRPYPIAIEKITLPDPRKLMPDLSQELATLLTDMVAFDLETRKNLKGFISLKDRFESVHRNIFKSSSPHYKLNTADLKAGGFNNRAVSYLELGKENEAVRCWEQALNEDFQHLETTFNYGYYRWKKGALYKDVLRPQMINIKGSHESRHEYWRYLAWLHFENDDYDAIKEIQSSKNRINDSELLELFNINNTKEKRGNIFRGHNEGVISVAFDASGRRVISGSYDNTVRLWDSLTGKEITCFEVYDCGVQRRPFAFSTAGRYALAGNPDHTFSIWEILTGRELGRFYGHERYVLSLAFSTSPNYFFSGSYDKTIRLWDAVTGKEIRRFDGHDNAISALALSPDNKYLLSGSWDRTIRIWDIETSKQIRIFNRHEGHVKSVAFSPDGRSVVSGSDDEDENGTQDNKYNLVRIWDVATGKEIKKFEGHSSNVESVAFSPCGHYVLSGSYDDTIRIWDVSSGKEIRRFEGHTAGVTSVVFSSDGQYILSGSSDKTVRIYTWDMSTHMTKGSGPYPALSRIRPPTEILSELTEIESLMESAVTCIEKGDPKKAYRLLRQIQALPGNERNKSVLALIAQCGIKGQGIRQNCRAIWLKSIFKGHRVQTHSVAFSPDSRYFISSSGDENGCESEAIRLWDVESGKEIRNFGGNINSVLAIAFSPDGKYFVSSSGDPIHDEDKKIRLWDVESGKEIRNFDGHGGWVSSVAFSPDGSYVVSGGGDWIHDKYKTMQIWEVRSGKRNRHIFGPNAGVYSVAFSPDGKYIVSASCNETGAGDKNISIGIWDVVYGKEIRRFEGHTERVTSVIFSSDGRYILSGSWDKSIRIWDVLTGNEIRRFEGQIDCVNSVAFSPDGRYVLSVSMDNTIRIWNTKTGEILYCLDGNDYIISANFSPDARYIVSGAGKDILLWEIDWDWEFNNDT